MAHSMYHDSGQAGRSVLGMLAVQVERDPKTGATIVRSVAPVSSPAGAPTATTVFDDGRKSIHAVGGSVAQPSNEELSQILRAVNGVGMDMLLDEGTVPQSAAEMTAQDVGTSESLEEEVLSFSTHDVVLREVPVQLDSSGIKHVEAGVVKVEKCDVSITNTDDNTVMMVRSAEEQVQNMEGQRLEEDPVTLVFLGYADDTSDQGDGEDARAGMLTAERVIITEDGEEQVFGQEMSASPQSALAEGAEQEAARESQDKGLSDVPVDGSGAEAKAQGREGDNGKHKTCQCCSVM
ncbi:paralemmin-1-like [Cololabis saira]|uniref:paralemmin-1-like n=1 Tax=Cololabis saira TaxID=129043 RepID=UPI002AD42C29|nr:paralemmin-1-like [Cololabis saira]